MRRLLTLQLVQSTLTNFARLNSRLAVLGQILTGRNIVVETVAHFGAARAHQSICENPVGHQEPGRKVRGLLARGGAEADCAQNGTAIVSGDSCHGEMARTTWI